MHLALNFQRVDPSRGGAETYVADLCSSLIQGGHRVDLYAESWADDCLPREVNVVPVAGTGRTRWQRIANFAATSEQVLRHGAHECSVGFINTWAHDVIIPQGGVQPGSVRANAQRHAAGLPRGLYYLAKVAHPKYWLYRAIEQRQYDPQRRARVVAVSKMVRRDLEAFHRVPRERIHVVPNAIDPRRLDVPQPGAVRCAFRNRLGLEPTDLVGLFVGHNFALKGLGPLLQGLAARWWTDRTRRPIHLLVCGNGDTGRYRRRVRELGLQDVVHFLGFYPDIRDCYWSSDFFVQPTFYDPCSLVVLEALACGLPVITTAQNGAGELMSNGRQGYVLSAPGARAELIASMDHMAHDPTRLAMSAEARRLGRRWTFDAHVARLLEIFQEVAAAKRQARPSPHKRRAKAPGPHMDQARKSRH
jgi:UDP-glucose:(heptosyl)LPS alpha-1,3-glucosyltransferase